VTSDALRTPTLVARDLASLASALGAQAAACAEWWRVLAAKLAGPGVVVDADTSTSEGAHSVRRYIHLFTSLASSTKPACAHQVFAVTKFSIMCPLSFL
jgi:hypothetical protein